MWKHTGIVAGILLSFSVAADTYTDPAKAFAEALAAQKPVLLVFQGSDWCLPCIRLEKKVLSQESFRHYIEDKAVVLYADFPQNKKVAEDLQQQYDQLADTYNKEGSFPKMLLLDAAGNPLLTLRTDYLEPSELIQDLEADLNKQHAAE